MKRVILISKHNYKRVLMRYKAGTFVSLINTDVSCETLQHSGNDIALYYTVNAFNRRFSEIRRGYGEPNC